MRTDVIELVNQLEREARGNPGRGLIRVDQINSMRPINQLGIMGRESRPPSQRNAAGDADPGMPGSTATGWIKPPTPPGGFVSFKSLLDSVIRGNPNISYPDAFTFARQLVQPGTMAKMDGATLTKAFADLDPQRAGR